MNYCIVFITCSEREEAERITHVLLDRQLIACANIVSDVQSFFWWKGAVDNAREILLIVKTKANQFEKICRLVKEHHSYEVPEIIALPILMGSQEYLQWIDESVTE